MQIISKTIKVENIERNYLMLLIVVEKNILII